MLSLSRFVPGAAVCRTAAVAAVAALSGCASNLVQVPPRFDLANQGRMALVTFSTDPSKVSLGAQATRQFAEELLDAQSGFELLELGPADTAVARLLAAGDAPGAAQRLGRERELAAVFFGQLAVTGTKPSGSIGGGGSVSVSGTVSGELSVRLLSASSGGTLWRSSATTSKQVGQVSMNGRGLPTISATDPNAAYADMVEALVAQVTRDFRPTWVKQ